MAQEETIIPFTPEEYGIALRIIVDFANLIIQSDTEEKVDIDPSWPLIIEFFQRMHGATLDPRPRNNSELHAKLPDIAKGRTN